MTEPKSLIGNLLREVLANRPAIVLCGREDDAAAWRSLLDDDGSGRCLAIALDVARSRPTKVVGATEHLAWQHATIAGLDGSGWLSREADTFDPDLRATLILPDPLDPPLVGSRPRIGRRPPAWRLLEDKTAVDTVWDALGIPRAQSIVADLAMDPRALGALVDRGAGVVCSSQSGGTAMMAGGDGVRWWRSGEPPRIIGDQPFGSARVRLMPLLEGLPVRLHGLVLPSCVVGFPPMEIVALPRPEHGSFLCAGTVPTSTNSADLTGRTEDIGTALGDQFGYRGAFAVDGVLTVDGFMPTDFNARLTSAIEDGQSDLRVPIQAINLLIRDGIEPESQVVRLLVNQIFSRKAEYTIYGAAGRTRENAPCSTDVRWTNNRLFAAQGDQADGHLTLRPSLRGWQLTARLIVDRLPAKGPVGLSAPEVFRFCDRTWETDFGELVPAFGLRSLWSRRPEAPHQLRREPPPERLLDGHRNSLFRRCSA